ncbi:hypothetical protein HD554DRAFT_975730 [Boletus coccyginus]|nr:hypothetical protein HD554DRAFT_975730 [Boletus coccyginus]
MPPQGSVTSRSGSGTIATSTIRTPHSADTLKPNGLAMSIQTPRQIQRHPPPLPEAFPPRAVATSPLSADAADQAMHDPNQGSDKDEDAFLATADLGKSDLGRPIDFDEGIGGESVMGGSVLKPELDSVEQSTVAPPRPEHQVRDGARSGSDAGSSSGGPPKMNGQNGVQGQPAEKAPTSANAEPHASGSGVHPHLRSGTPRASASTPITYAGPSARPSVDEFRRPPEHQVRDGVRSGSITGSSGGPPAMNAWNGPQGQPAKKATPSVNAEANASGSGAHPQPRGGTPHAVSTSSMRAGSSTQTSVDGSRPLPSVGPLSCAITHASPCLYARFLSSSTLHYFLHRFGGQKPGLQLPPKTLTPACVRTTPGTPQSGQTNALKRSADVMQLGLVAASTNPRQGSYPKATAAECQPAPPTGHERGQRFQAAQTLIDPTHVFILPLRCIIAQPFILCQLVLRCQQQTRRIEAIYRFIIHVDNCQSALHGRSTTFEWLPKNFPFHPRQPVNL